MFDVPDSFGSFKILSNDGFSHCHAHAGLVLDFPAIAGGPGERVVLDNRVRFILPARED